MLHAPARYQFIDSLRGYAILMVIAVHIVPYFNALPPTLKLFAVQGARGVQLFFVVSAFTLCASWNAREDGAAAFYVRRLFRIAPMFWLAVVFFVAVQGTGPRAFAPFGISDRHIVMTILFLHGLWPDTITSVVPGGWSIADEAIFYAIFPFLIAPLLDARWRTVLVVTALSIVIGAQLSRLLVAYADLMPESARLVAGPYFFLWFPRQLPCFLFGVLLYKGQAGRGPPPRWVSRTACAAALAAMVMIPLIQDDRYALPLGLQTSYGLAFVLLTYGLMSWPAAPLSNRVMSWLGKISYSAYFVHFAVLELLPPLPSSGSEALDFALKYAVTVALTVPLASLTYLLIEKPCIALGNSLLTGRRAREQLVRV